MKTGKPEQWNNNIENQSPNIHFFFSQIKALKDSQQCVESIPSTKWEKNISKQGEITNIIWQQG